MDVEVVVVANANAEDVDVVVVVLVELRGGSVLCIPCVGKRLGDQD